MPWHPCPFCGGNFALDHQQEALAHTQPFCTQFELLDPADFLARYNDITLGKQEADRRRAIFDRKSNK